MERFDDELARAGEALRGLADGPGREAANALEQAFNDAGQSIETVLSRAARSGELDFSRMARSILGDLAQIAAETALARTGAAAAAPTFTLNFSGEQTTSKAASKAELAKAVAKAAAIGGRYR